ncbi:Dihydrofolate reductase [Tenacibaculum sp. MAR_2009_124]|uniref:dihydrofolate reductase family protein n=1 Tax=Tenacibaculum sp. MAR_2009_124 TaxID=1250059 RepID=UPI00089B3152|nr:dihydrofolate reductase family protein [Tenacibaculum sp. MAR_2009_124]SEB36255.1 Dihydrofolate reductase [Tenacibaculum sp. MAR_2009_124]
MKTKNSVFIATSIDGYISDKNGKIDWLNTIPNPSNDDMGYNEFMIGIDALVMGRKTFETVCSFDVDWPYEKPVFVLSNSLQEVEEELKDKVFLIHGSLKEVLHQIRKKGFKNLYIDGGATIQSFLKEDLIDEFVITTIPILLGGGTSLFSELPKKMEYELVNTKQYLNAISQNRFRRKRIN